MTNANERRRRHLGIATAFAVAAQVAPLVAALGISLVVAHERGSAGTGVVALMVSLAGVTLIFFSFDLRAGIVYFVSRGEWHPRRAAKSAQLAAICLGGLAAIAGGAFYYLTRDNVFRHLPYTVALISLASIPLAMLWVFIGGIALGEARYAIYSGVEVLHASVWLVCGVTLTLLWGLLGVAIAFAAANLVAAAAAVAWVRRSLSVKRGVTDVETASLREALGFGIKTWSSNLLQLLNYRADIFILAGVAATSAVGVYSVAVSVTALGWLLPNALQTVLFPRTADLAAETERGVMSRSASDLAATRSIRHTVLLLIPTGVGLVILLWIIPAIYGAEFGETVKLGLLLIPGVLGAAVAKVLTAVTTGRGFPIYAVRTNLSTVPVTLLLYLVLIPRWHATGAAVASSMSYLMTTALSAYYFRKATGVRLKLALVPTSTDLRDYQSIGPAMRNRFARTEIPPEAFDSVDELL